MKQYCRLSCGVCTVEAGKQAVLSGTGGSIVRGVLCLQCIQVRLSRSMSSRVQPDLIGRVKGVPGRTFGARGN